LSNPPSNETLSKERKLVEFLASLENTPVPPVEETDEELSFTEDGIIYVSKHQSEPSLRYGAVVEEFLHLMTGYEHDPSDKSKEQRFANILIALHYCSQLLIDEELCMEWFGKKRRALLIITQLADYMHSLCK